MRKVRIGAGTNRYKIEQLETLLQQKRKQLAKLERIHRVLAEREQVVSGCISQQVDLLEVLGQLAFSLPEPGDAAYEAKATAAVEALLKDMEVAQLMQAADSISTVSTDSAASDSTTQAPQQPQQLLPVEQERFTVATLRRLLQSPECMQTLRRVGCATAEELAGIIQEQTMQVGFAIARYPSNTYLDAAALEAVTDEQQRRRMEAGNTRLNAALGALGTTNLLLHIVGDKVLRLSTLNLETLQPETPPGSFWEELAAKLSIPPQQMAQLHTGFLIYSNKRSELTAGMQETMTQLQQLLKLVLQDTHEQPTNKQQQQQPAKHQDDSADSQDPQQADSNDSSTSKFSRSSSACMPNKAADAVASGKHSAVPSTDVMLQNLEDADALLQQLSRQVWCLREASRCLIFQYCNVLDPLQLSMSAVHAWPYIVQPPPLLEVLVRQQVARQQREDSATDEEG